MWLDRQLLQFTSELGKGWFGFVLRGTLLNLSSTFEQNYNYEELKSPMTETRYAHYIGCRGASQLGGPCEGAHQGYKANKLKSH